MSTVDSSKLIEVSHDCDLEDIRKDLESMECKIVDEPPKNYESLCTCHFEGGDSYILYPDTKTNYLVPNVVGIKHDKAKLRLDLIPVSTFKGLGDVLTHGANKYGDRNWEKGLMYSRVYGALLRHVIAWWDGEEFDPESGVHHLDSVLANASFLKEYVSNPDKFGSFDDRPVSKAE